MATDAWEGHAVSMDQSSTVLFNVSGRHFEVLQLTIEARPTTLLATLLHDIGTDRTRPIFVDANPDRFSYILDWYRFGEMHIPRDYSVEALLGDARFFLLPDLVRVNGTPYWLHPGFSNQAEELRTKCILDEWPAFDQYVMGIIAEVQKDIEVFCSEAKLLKDDVPQKSSFIREPPSRVALPKTCFVLSKAIYYEGFRRWKHVWLDPTHVCSRERLRVLVAELTRRGFECDFELGDGNGAPHSSAPLTLQVGHRDGGADFEKVWTFKG